MLDALINLFDRDGYHILRASNAGEGFEALALNEVQVILWAPCTPLASGTEFLGKVKELYPQTFRIVLSGDKDTQYILDALNSGAVSRFFTKPCSNRPLRDSVRGAFRNLLPRH